MKMKNQAHISFIGGGNMARSLIGGLIADGYDPKNLSICDPDTDQLTRIKTQFPVRCDTHADTLIAESDCVLFAVKPQFLKQAILENRNALLARSPLLISIVAGVRESSMRRWLGKDLAIIRCMPNTPAILQTSATALHANPWASAEQKNRAESILRAVGLTVWLDNEEQLNAVTALSGSGPAYYFFIMEIMQQAGEKMGLSTETARLLTLQTALGAAKMALESSETPAQLRERVTSKRGTTESALNVLHEGHFAALIEAALRAAEARGKELGELFNE